MRNHIKLLHVYKSRRGFFKVVWLILAMGLADLWGRKVESTKWLKHKPRATLRGQQFEQTDGGSGFPFPLRFVRGQLEFVTQVFGDYPKLSSSELAIP